MIIPISPGYYTFKWVSHVRDLDSGHSEGRSVLTILSLILFQLAPRCPGPQEWDGLQNTPLLGSHQISYQPSPFCVQTAAHTGLGTGIFFAVILVLGAIALAAYSYFRLNRRTIGFQHFEVRRRKMGTRGWGPLCSPAPGSGLLQLTGCFPELTAGGCLAHTSCRQAGVFAPKSSSSRSAQPLFLAETGFGERVMGRQ